jgi:polar amino acid transport system substrate-binding protein
MNVLRYLAFLLGICVASSAIADGVPAMVRSELAPAGKLRVGLNLTNIVTFTKDAQSGELRGVAVDLGRALAAELGLAFEPVLYATAPKLVEAVGSGEWDVAFMAADPARAGEIAFTAPYMEVHNTYMVPPGSTIQTIADVDQPGVRIAVHERNANDLFLSRTLRHAKLVRVATEAATLEMLRTGQAEALASARGLLLARAAIWPGARVLDGRFLAVGHAIGMPVGRDNGFAYLSDFVEKAKRSGQVQQMLDRQGVAGVFLAPVAPTK